MAKLALNDGGEDEDFEKSSTYSIFNSSMSNFNPQAMRAGIDFTNSKKGKLTDDNLDDYLENLLQKQRDKYRDADRDFIENNDGIKEMREVQKYQMEELMEKDGWKQNLEDIKQMNQVDLKQYVNRIEELHRVEAVSDDEEISENKLLKENEQLQLRVQAALELSK